MMDATHTLLTVGRLAGEEAGVEGASTCPYLYLNCDVTAIAPINKII